MRLLLLWSIKIPEAHLSSLQHSQQHLITNLIDHKAILSSSELSKMGWPTASNNNRNNYAFPNWVNEYVHISPKTKAAIDDLCQVSTAQAAFIGVSCGASFMLGWRFAKAGSSWRRITSIADIPSAKIGPDSPFLRGRVVSVSDGDTIRLLHVPSLFHSSRLQDGKKISEETLQIRLCTIDTPETAKFGKPGQPFGEEAKEHLGSMIQEKMVKIRLLEKDQYGRGVAEVMRPGFFFGFPKKYMDQEMLQAGLAEVYQGSGAVYGHKGKEAYLAMEEKARNKKRGMWSQKNRESAAEFKARMKAEG